MPARFVDHAPDLAPWVQFVPNSAAEISATADFPGGLYHDEVISAVLYAGSEMNPADARVALRAGTARQTRVVTEPASEA